MARTTRFELPIHGQTGRVFTGRRTGQWLTERAISPHLLFLGDLRQEGWRITKEV